MRRVVFTSKVSRASVFFIFKATKITGPVLFMIFFFFFAKLYQLDPVSPVIN